ncbi:MAG: class I tRNA ligase family protein [Firmicutes bacterium]|nr:class I tRNA ligase family protein [Bacillota bacterium]
MKEIRKIEKKWQDRWAKARRFSVDTSKADKNNRYVLAEFPYPSGAGLHVGHAFTFIPADVHARKLRLEGMNVIFPMGMDAFGLEAERTAIKFNKSPEEIVKTNVERFYSQIKTMGLGIDWNETVNTSDPEYYKWTQWLWLQFYKAGHLYKATKEVNMCPSCGVLANEEVLAEDKCIQCSATVTKEQKAQWFFKITAYADRLIEGLDSVNYLDYIKKQQINYIGRKIDEKGNKTYNLHDWVFSRQRYWGEPMPIVHCSKCGMVPLSEKDLPLLLPKVENFNTLNHTDSPLKDIAEWVNTKCPKCKGPAKRETDIMPGWAGSSWYFFRYLDTKNTKSFCDFKKIKNFLPINYYYGGNEHTTAHLIYARYWTKMMYDLGLSPVEEFCDNRISHGIILASDGTKMSKSKGNVVDPSVVIEEIGADALRLGLCFIGDYQDTFPYSEDAMKACKKFIERVWELTKVVDLKVKNNPELAVALNQCIKKVSDDIDSYKFNTAIAAIMTLLNDIKKAKTIGVEDYKTLLILLNPYAPHITEEIWEQMKFPKEISDQRWPIADEKKLVKNIINLPVQLNAKMKGTIEISPTAPEAEAKTKACAKLGIKVNEIESVVYVPGRIINIIK